MINTSFLYVYYIIKFVTHYERFHCHEDNNVWQIKEAASFLEYNMLLLYIFNNNSIPYLENHSWCINDIHLPRLIIVHAKFRLTTIITDPENTIIRRKIINSIISVFIHDNNFDRFVHFFLHPNKMQSNWSLVFSPRCVPLQFRHCSYLSVHVRCIPVLRKYKQ